MAALLVALVLAAPTAVLAQSPPPSLTLADWLNRAAMESPGTYSLMTLDPTTTAMDVEIITCANAADAALRAQDIPGPHIVVQRQGAWLLVCPTEAALPAVESALKGDTVLSPERYRNAILGPAPRWDWAPVQRPFYYEDWLSGPAFGLESDRGWRTTYVPGPMWVGGGPRTWEEAQFWQLRSDFSRASAEWRNALDRFWLLNR